MHVLNLFVIFTGTAPSLIWEFSFSKLSKRHNLLKEARSFWLRLEPKSLVCKLSLVFWWHESLSRMQKCYGGQITAADCLSWHHWEGFCCKADKVSSLHLVTVHTQLKTAHTLSKLMVGNGSSVSVGGQRCVQKTNTSSRNPDAHSSMQVIDSLYATVTSQLKARRRTTAKQ